jgi:hypothetical protein
MKQIEPMFAVETDPVQGLSIVVRRPDGTRMLDESERTYVDRAAIAPRHHRSTAWSTAASSPFQPNTACGRPSVRRDKRSSFRHDEILGHAGQRRPQNVRFEGWPRSNFIPANRIEAVCDEDGCVFDILRQG